MEYRKPADIERASMEIIDGELAARGIVLSGETAAVVRRVIHATADFDYAETLKCTPGAVARGVEALAAGAVVITDTNMALSGVSGAGLRRLGGQKCCFMADLQVAEAARARGVTRAVVSVEKAAREYPGCVYAAGNAPTALLELVWQMENGFRPALVVGVPVGFVNVLEAKQAIWEACLRLEVPAIVAMGRKGGSTVAAAILNALIYQAADLADPRRRGW